MTVTDVIVDVSNAMGVTVADIRGSRRQRHLTLARMTIAHRLFDAGMDYRSIGQVIGGRTPWTVQYLLGRLGRKPKAHSPVLAMLIGGLGTDE